MADNEYLSKLPVPVADMPGRNLPMTMGVYQSPNFVPDLVPEPEVVPLSHYLWILKRNWWRIMLFVVCSVAGTVVLSGRLVPVYESTATVDIDRQMPSGVIGQESMRTMANDSDQFLATQAKLIQSDSVLRPVAEQYQLNRFDSDVKD